METPKNFFCISGNGNPKKLLIFWEMELLIPSSNKQTNKQKDKFRPEKISYTP